MERDEACEAEVPQSPSGTKIKSLTAYQTSKSTSVSHRSRKPTYPARPFASLSSPTQSRSTEVRTGRGEVTDRGAVYGTRGGLYCSEACRQIDDLSGQRAFEDLALVAARSLLSPTPSPKPRSPTPAPHPGRRRPGSAEPESDDCPSTTSGTDEDLEGVGARRRRRLSILDSNASVLTTATGSSSLSKASALPILASGHLASGLRGMTPLSDGRPAAVRCHSDHPPAPAPPGPQDQPPRADLGPGRQCRSVEGGLAYHQKKKTPVLLAPNGTPLIQPTFPQKQRPQPAAAARPVGSPLSQPVHGLAPGPLAAYSSLPSYHTAGVHLDAGQRPGAAGARGHVSRGSESEVHFKPTASTASLVADYSLFFSGRGRRAEEGRRAGLGAREGASQTAQGGEEAGRRWSWNHLPADVPQYPVMDLARVRRSRIQMMMMVEEGVREVEGGQERNQGMMMMKMMKKNATVGPMPTRKKLFVFNSHA